MKQLLRSIFRRYLEARQRKADALVLEHLDERTLRDIGLEAWQSPDGRTVRRRRHQDALAWRAILSPSAGGLQ